MSGNIQQNEEEFRFAQQMKDTYCDESGKETNPAMAAEILHQIGLIYRKRSPDKIALIKSAGLLNAAIVRNPPNVSQIKSDLSELCRHILETSNAKKQNVDLVEKSKEVKIAIEKLRSEVEIFLETNVPKISANVEKEDLHLQKMIYRQRLKSDKVVKIKQINKFIAQQYKQNMKDLSNFCEEVMGKPPCEYAIAGMGSLAREEITPYSDFEHIILLCDDKNHKSYVEYFKWFSVIFHIVVLNVQETIIPSLNIVSLNDNESSLGDWFYDDVTPRGISFDGMMPHACKFPLGRQQHTKNKQFTTELIKPVSEMLEYLSSDEDLKNGYHLADILTKTCFVFGNKDIFKQFAHGAQKYLDTKSQTFTIIVIKKQVKEDLNSFSTRFRLSKLKSQHTINIKQLVYRSTTIFISALARKHNISANSCFDIIDEMAENNYITQNTAEKLKFAIAIACEMRLRVYMGKKSQCDNAIDLKRDGIEKFLDIVEVICTINYFQIAYCLQCEVAKQLNFTKLHFYTDPQLINITIGLTFGIQDVANFSTNPQNRFWRSRDFNFDTCIAQLETENNLQVQVFDSRSRLNEEQLKPVVRYLHSIELFDEALDFYKQLLVIYERKSKNINQDYEIAKLKHVIGVCLYRIHQPAEALQHFSKALEIKQNVQLNTITDLSIAATLHNIAQCHIDLHNYDDAVTVLQQALDLFQNVETTLGAWVTADLLHTISICYKYLHRYDQALSNLHIAIQVKQNRTLNADTDRGLATTIQMLGCCHMDLNHHNVALSNLNRALEIYQNSTLNADTDTSIADTHRWAQVR